MTDLAIERPFPLLRVVILGLIILVSRIMKWVIPALCLLFLFVWIFPVMLHLLDGAPLKVEGGTKITLTEVLTQMIKVFGIGIVCFVVGELLIRLNERLALSIAEHMGEDIDKM